MYNGQLEHENTSEYVGLNNHPDRFWVYFKPPFVKKSSESPLLRAAIRKREADKISISSRGKRISANVRKDCDFEEEFPRLGQVLSCFLHAIR